MWKFLLEWGDTACGPYLRFHFPFSSIFAYWNSR